MKHMMHCLSTLSVLLMVGVSGLAYAEKVVEMTIEDVGQGTAVHNTTLDRVAAGFRFGPMLLNLDPIPAVPAISPPSDLCYKGSKCFVTDVANIDASVAQAPDAFTTGFIFAFQPFRPMTDAPILADVANDNLTVTQLQLSGHFGAPDNLADVVKFRLGPQTPAEYALSGSSGPCNATTWPHQPLTVDWLVRNDETDEYYYRIFWNHCIQSDFGDSETIFTTSTDPAYILSILQGYDAQSAHFMLEGILTVEDTVAPDLTAGGRSPAAGSTNNSSTAAISVTFNEPMDAGTVTLTSFIVERTLAPAGTECSSIVASNNNKTFSCMPPTGTGEFTNNVDFTVTLANTITDDTSKVFGGGTRTNVSNVIAPYTFGIGVPDLTPPTHVINVPGDADTGVATNAVATVEFDEPMNTAVMTSVISLSTNGNAVDATITPSVDGKTYTITPEKLLSNNTVYTINVALTAADPSGNLLAGYTATTFTTIASPSLSVVGPGEGAGTAVVSVDTAMGLSMVSLKVLALSEITATPPVEVDFADEFIAYSINGVTGGMAEVTIQFPSDITGAVLYKVNDTAFTELVEGSAVGEYQRMTDPRTIKMTIADNGDQDTDPTTGAITDPIAAGFPQNIPQPEDIGLGGGCSINALNNSVLDRFDMLLMFGLILAFGLYRRRLS